MAALLEAGAEGDGVPGELGADQRQDAKVRVMEVGLCPPQVMQPSLLVDNRLAFLVESQESR